jgi:hypothetical protein
VIKGNISFLTGERIYHVPGQRYYDKTVINVLQGERWFCTEQEAIAAVGENQRSNCLAMSSNKCLAQINKSSTGIPATGSPAQVLWALATGEPRRWISALPV